MKTTLTESKRLRAGQTAIARIALPATGSDDYFDAGYPGLCLRVSHAGRRTWYHFYRSPLDRKLVRRKLGVLPLDDARSAWRKDRELLKDGIDPEEVRRRRVEAAAAERAAAKTYREAVEDYHRRYQVGEAGNASADGVRDALLREGGLRKGADVVDPAWLDRRVDSITAAEVGALVEGIRDGGRKVWANRVYAHLRHFFKWCASPGVGFVARSPMEGLTRPTKEERVRDRWFSADEVAALWRAADWLGVYEGAYLRVILLTGKRKRALAAMHRDEVGADGWWRPRDAKARGKKLHLPIPLPAAALKVVRGLPPLDENPFVFPGRRRDQHLDPGTSLLRKVRAASGVADFYWHACRDTIATHLKDLRVPGNAIRRYLDHAQTRDAHERSYTHDEMAMATEDAAEAWGRYVTLVARRRAWARVSAHLDATDVPEGDARREAQRARKRQFCALLQAGGEPWVRWVTGIARPRPAARTVVPLRRR